MPPTSRPEVAGPLEHLRTKSEVPAEPAPDLSVQVVTYDNAHCLPGLFESVRCQTGVRYEVCFADNASRDESAESVAGSGLGTLVRNAENVGFGRAHNQLFANARGRYLLLLNPDLTFPDGLFSTLVRLMDANPQVGVAGPGVLEGRRQREFRPRRFYPGEGLLPLTPELERSEIAWVNGCCLIVRRVLFEAVGGFDPDYPLYLEETDLCRRIRGAGFSVTWTPTTQVRHLGRQSQTGLSHYAVSRRVFEGCLVFWEKHYSERERREVVFVQYWLSRLLLPWAPLLGRFPAARGRLGRDRLRARVDALRCWMQRRGFRPLRDFPFPTRVLRAQLRLLHHMITRWHFPLDDL